MQRSHVVLLSTYATRLEAADQLRAAAGREGGNPEALRAAAGAIDESTTGFSDTKIAVTHTAFAELLRVVAQLVDWRTAVIGAAVDADRFQRAARTRLAGWQAEYGDRDETTVLAPIAEALAAVDQPMEIGALCGRLGATPLPIAVDGTDRRPWFRAASKTGTSEPEPEPPVDLSVAFISFAVDGAAAATLDYLTPEESHDLEIEVRVSRWPEGATTLRLTPISIEAASSYELPTFELTRPPGDPPHTVRQRGRARILGGQALRAQPFEFRYAAEFAPQAAEQPVAVVGHRTLRFESIDAARSPLTSDPAMDRRLIEIRNTLRETSAMPQADIEAAMSLATALSRLAVRALADNIFPDPIAEKAFQAEVRDELRRDPVVGLRLTVHGNIAAGIADLGLGGVPLELKVDHQSVRILADGQPYVEQAIAYAVGAGKRVAVLGLLNAPRRTVAARPASDGIGILKSESGLPVVTVLIPGAIPRPSDLSP
jgi:hypothetical protein